jgi:hypothetical protein
MASPNLRKRRRAAALAAEGKLPAPAAPVAPAIEEEVEAVTEKSVAAKAPAKKVNKKKSSAKKAD